MEFSVPGKPCHQPSGQRADFLTIGALPGQALIRIALAALAGSFALLAAGCGYSLGYRAPPMVARIAVPIFDNQTFPLRREIEYELTDAFRKEIQARTDLVLVDQGGADMVVYGTVTDFQERVIAEGRRDEKTESTISVTVILEVEDYQNRKRWRQRLRDDEPLSVESGETLDVARGRAIGNLAERMLTAIEFWGEEEEGFSR